MGGETGAVKQAAKGDPQLNRRTRLDRVKRLVVKIGSSSLTTADNQLDTQVLQNLTDDVAALKRQGREVAIVSSGAVAAGMGQLGLVERPQAIGDLQAVAAVGQVRLMATYEELFARQGLALGQVLLTAEDILDNRQRYVNLENTFSRLFSYGAVPVINENDSVAVAELKRTIGENDALAAYVTNLIRAQLLIVLSDVEGLYTEYGAGGPRGELMRYVHYGDTEMEKVIAPAKSRQGSGGMETKVRAAKLLMVCGEMSIIAHARRHRLVDIMAGQELGTLFVPPPKRLQSRKRWIAFAAPTKGRVVVDGGAQRAIATQGKSLLPAGVVGCGGAFKSGEVVRVENEKGTEVARGLVNYGSSEIQRIAGCTLAQVEKLLNRPGREVIHRDDLVLFDAPIGIN